MENVISEGFFMGGLTYWYDRYMAQQIDLIAAYIEEGEIAISEAQLALKKYEQIEVENPDEPYYIIHTYFRELDGDTFNLQDIYREYFPMLSRHSTLVMVMSMFEKKLFDLCEWVQNEFNLTQTFMLFQRKHKSKLLAIKIYLSTEVKLIFSQTLEEYWSDLISLNSIRNNIVHNFGKYEYHNIYIDSFMEKNNIKISKDNEFILSNTFLSDLNPFFNSFCLEIQNSIRQRTN